MSRCAIPALFVTGLLVSSCTPIEILTQQTAVLVAHRGASHAAPECTIPAYELAIEEGADYFEGDFWLTRDERIVCIHDPTTKRVAPGGQPVLSVQDSTLDELKKLDVGVWKGAQFKGTRIPTIEEILDIIPEGKGVYIEIKDDRPQIVPHLTKVLAKSKLKHEQQVVIAFDPDIIKAVKTELPGVKALWLYWWYHDTKTGKLSNTADEIIRVARAIGADGLDINACKWVNAEFIRRVREAGLESHIYTINDIQDATRYMALGVDTMTTDYPKNLRKETEDYFHPLEDTSDVSESLTVHDDGTWTFLPYRPKD